MSNTNTIIIDRIKLPVYNTVNVDDLEERELVYEISSQSLVVKVNDALVKISNNDTIITNLYDDLKQYIEQYSMPVPIYSDDTSFNNDELIDGQVYFNKTDKHLYVYYDGLWYRIESTPDRVDIPENVVTGGES